MQSDARFPAQGLVQACAVSVARCRDVLSDLMRCLLPEELARASRFHKEADQHRFIVGRSMIRRLGGRYFNIEPQHVGLGQSANGKPNFVDGSDKGTQRLEFNISHSGDCVLIAWSEGSPVGVDVELADFNASLSFPELAKASFSDAEHEVFSASRDENHAAVFYRIWVRKEAVLKAEGWGLNGPLKDFSVVRQSATESDWLEAVESPQSGCIWAVRDIPFQSDHVAALAMPVGCEVRFVSPEEAGLLLNEDS